MTKTIDVTDFINTRKVSGYQVMVLVLCFFVVALDGFDAAAVSYIALALVTQWKVKGRLPLSATRALAPSGSQAD